MENRNNLSAARSALANALTAGDLPSGLSGFDQTEQLLAATRLNTMSSLGAANNLSALLGASAYQNSLSLGLGTENIARPALPVSLSSSLTLGNQLARQQALQQMLSMPLSSRLPSQDLQLLQRRQLLQQQELLLQQDASLGVTSTNQVPTMTNEDILNMTGLRKDQKKATGKGSRPKKPKDMPRRPLSAYNIFFKEERAKILGSAASEDSAAPQDDEEGNTDGAIPRETDGDRKTRTPHGKIGFENLAKTIGRRWKNLDPTNMERYKALAHEDMERYRREMDDYRVSQVEKKKQKELIIIEKKVAEKAESPAEHEEEPSTPVAEALSSDTAVVEGNKGRKRNLEATAKPSPDAVADKKPEQYQRSYLKRMKLNNPFAPSSSTSVTGAEKEEKETAAPPQEMSAPVRHTPPGMSSATLPGIGTNALLARALAVRSGLNSNAQTDQRTRIAAAASLLALPQGQNTSLPGSLPLDRMRFHLP